MFAEKTRQLHEVENMYLMLDPQLHPIPPDSSCSQSMKIFEEHKEVKMPSSLILLWLIRYQNRLNLEQLFCPEPMQGHFIAVWGCKVMFWYSLTVARNSGGLEAVDFINKKWQRSANTIHRSYRPLIWYGFDKNMIVLLTSLLTGSPKFKLFPFIFSPSIPETSNFILC